MRDQWGYIKPPRRRKKDAIQTPTPEERFNARFGAGRYAQIEAGDTATCEEILLLAEFLQPKPEANFERQFRHTGQKFNKHGLPVL